MFDLQAFVARDIMIGKISLPTKEERQKNNDEWLAREEKLSNPHEDIRYQVCISFFFSFFSVLFQLFVLNINFLKD